MQRSFLEEFDHVQASLLKMGEVVEYTIRDAVDSLKDHDSDKARGVINSDDLIDSHQIVIEEGVMGLLSLETPVSSDLRRIIAFVKIANDLERVGDYACNIAEIALELRDEGVHQTSDPYSKAGRHLARHAQGFSRGVCEHRLGSRRSGLQEG